MNSKIILTPQPFLKEGVNAVADAVEITLGARGNNVGIAKANPHGDIYDRTILHDGVSVAQAIHLKDERVNFSAQVLIEAARKQRDSVGDGTTVTICLARAIINQAEQITAAGTNPQELRPDIEAGITKLITQITKQSTQAQSTQDLIKIATISSEDKELGELIGRTLAKVGVDATVTAEESKSPETTVDHQTGMQFEHGWYHEFFVTNPERMEATLEHPYILVTDKPINSLVPLAQFLNEFITKAKKLVIISPDISRDALGLFVQNKLEGKMLPLCIKAPAFGQMQKDLLADIATVTGATFFTEDAGHEFEKLTMKDLGKAQSVTCTREDTIISGGMGSKKRIAERVKIIKGGIPQAKSEFEKLKMQERLGKLTNGVAVIHVGGHTEIEMKERRERVIDGIAATKAAMREGIVPGGEIIYLDIRNILDQSILAEKILYKALEQPFRKLVENAGYDPGQMLERLRDTVIVKDVEGFGIDVKDGQVKNFLKEGIIDPTAVSIGALFHASSVACQIITTKALVLPDTDKDNEMPKL